MTPILTAEEIAEIEKRVNAATAGPWDAMFLFGGKDLPMCVQSQRGIEVCLVGENYTARNKPTPNFRFIAASRTDVPNLIASHRELERRLKVAEDAMDEAVSEQGNRYSHACAGWDCSRCAPITNPIHGALAEIRKP